MPILKETEMSLSYIQCFLYLVSSSINVSIFHIMWVDTFWTGQYTHMHTVLGMVVPSVLFFTVILFYFILFREREGRKKEKERNINVREKHRLVTSHVPLLGTKSTT